MLRKPDKIEETPEGGWILTYRCPACRNVTSIVLNQDEVRELFSALGDRNQRPIQDILPGKSHTELELMMTGYCPDCQEAFLAG